LYQALHKDDKQSRAGGWYNRESQAQEAGTFMSAATSSRMETPASQEVLAKHVKVTGEIHSSEPLTIEGEVEGTIDVTGQLLTIAPNGNVRACVKAREIDVLGSLQGNVESADRVYIRNGARFVGHINSRGIVIEDGAFVLGRVDLSRQCIFPFSA
jgi:cytoskeletal protein CcmA (bactofilin family)